jgi:hypothetical protein
MNGTIYANCKIERVYGKKHLELVLQPGEEDVLLEAILRHKRLKRPGNFSLWYSPVSNQLKPKSTVLPKKRTKE